MSLWLGTLGGQITAPATVSVEYLVVAGGGGGGGYRPKQYGGGGGGGGYLSSLTGEQFDPGPETPLVADIGQPYQVTVGAGGAVNPTSSAPGANGANSVFASVLSLGGGGGGYTVGGISGGSGGGASSYVSSGGSGTPGQGHDGGGGSSYSYAGGGGGAAGPGIGSAAGPGIDTLIADGANYVTRSRGGNGGYSGSPVAAGAAATGNGGTGGRSNGLAGTGGSGIVCLRVPSAITATFSAGVVYTSYTSNGFTVYAITAAGASDTVVFS